MTPFTQDCTWHDIRAAKFELAYRHRMPCCHRTFVRARPSDVMRLFQYGPRLPGRPHDDRTDLDVADELVSCILGEPGCTVGVVVDGSDSYQSFHIGPALWCPCHQEISIPADVVHRYLAGEPATCSNCSASQDWWSALLGAVKSVMTVPLSVVGAHSTYLRVTLTPGRATMVDFGAAGVPEDAQILKVYYTPTSHDDSIPLFPMQVTTSQPEPPWIHRQVKIYGHPLDGREAVDSSFLGVFIAWLPAGDADASRLQLVSAFDAYTRGDYQPPNFEPCIIPANTAVEIAVGETVTSWLRRYVSKNKVGDFLDVATYGHQLNVLLPMLWSTLGYKPLPNHICGHLNRLRKLRNQIAHSGHTDILIAKDEAADCLCAAFFAVEYLRALGERRAADG